MAKKSRRNIGFEDSGDSPGKHHNEFECNVEGAIKSDEGECEDSDINSDDVEFDDGYDEDLMGDDNDRELLTAMTEVEREKELFKRMERREALKARHIIEKRLKAATNIKSKPSSLHDFPNNSKIRPKRNLIKSNQKSIDAIRNKRMKRKHDGTYHHSVDSTSAKIDTNNKKQNSNSPNNYTSHSLLPATSKTARKQRYLNGNFSDDNSEEEFVDTFQKKSLSPIKTLDEFNVLRISRHKLSLWMFQPFFEHKIPGFFVRFADSVPSHSNGSTIEHQSIYKAYEIIQILRSNKSYKFGEIVTNKFLCVRRGNDERVVRMEYVSNQLFVESEFRSYLEDVEKDDKPKPTLETVEKKRADMKFCIEFRPTERDIDYIVEQKNKFRKVPVNITAERHKVQVKIEEARQQNDMVLVEKFEHNLRSLDQQLECAHQKRAKQLDKIRLINERNRKSNNAQLEKVLESESTSWSSTSDTANLANNPFVRRRTNPIILSDKKIQNHFANKLKQDTVSLGASSNDNIVHNPPTSKNSTSDTVGEKLKQSDATSDTNQISNTTHNIFDISKDLENLYNFDLDISLDLEPQPTSKSYKAPKNASSIHKQKSQFP